MTGEEESQIWTQKAKISLIFVEKQNWEKKGTKIIKLKKKTSISDYLRENLTVFMSLNQEGKSTFTYINDSNKCRWLKFIFKKQRL